MLYRLSYVRARVILAGDARAFGTPRRWEETNKRAWRPAGRDRQTTSEYAIVLAIIIPAKPRRSRCSGGCVAWLEAVARLLTQENGRPPHCRPSSRADPTRYSTSVEGAATVIAAPSSSECQRSASFSATSGSVVYSISSIGRRSGSNGPMRRM
jgi:hypothetical protein